MFRSTRPWRRSVFIFRSDLRVEDNVGLLHALKRTSISVHPVFIFDPRQCDAVRNPYFGSCSFRFMVNSLAEMERQCPLSVFYGVAEEVVEKLIDPTSSVYIPEIDAVVFNASYTPFGRKRDELLAEVCARHHVACASMRGDYLLCEPEHIRTGTGKVYKVFGPFYKKASARIPVAQPVNSWPPEEGDPAVELCYPPPDLLPFLKVQEGLYVLQSCTRIVELIAFVHAAVEAEEEPAPSDAFLSMDFLAEDGDSLIDVSFVGTIANSEPVLDMASSMSTPTFSAVVASSLTASAIAAASAADADGPDPIARLPPMRDPTAAASEGYIARLYANRNSPHEGGRMAGLRLLAKTVQSIDRYRSTRDSLAMDFEEHGSSHLGPHLKFGTVSIREVYHALKSSEAMVRQLYFRDFYRHLCYNFPSLLEGQLREFHAPEQWAGLFNRNMQRKFDCVWWDSENSPNWYAFMRGETGFPVVDAGIRQMLATGEMHNRARMIVGCFLVKDLHLHWRLGEWFFASNLTDYDPSSNNGGWQWCASTGADSQPYFRIFNPWRQQERFDPFATYIKRWLPELAHFTAKELHNWTATCRTEAGQASGYPAPIVDHAEEARKAKEMFSVAAAHCDEEEDVDVGVKRSPESDNGPQSKKARVYADADADVPTGAA